ncbi:MAG TPA: tetratricopeptide repeat protein, partial [Thermoanaerobaculia bacterium]|nr:tetratricopeptide repeat protein [Thermoanaerobaculia bacterium]
HVKLADLFTQAKRIPEALREYGVVAGALAERGAHEESIRVYEKALRLAPDNVEILRTLVPLLLSINSVDPARAVLRKGLEASPRSVPLFLLAADAALAANDMAEARSFSDKARAVEPDNEDVLAAAVKVQLKGRRPDLAWAAAAPLAEAALRRGEAKKALALLVPIARAAPDVDDLVKKIVDIASGSGDEATALPFRSALAELYRKKGKLAEAADLLRHCSSVQPDNAEFRSRLAQLEPHAGVVSVAPPRVPPPTMERQMEVTLSGFEDPKPRATVQPAAAAPPPPTVIREAAPVSDEFEFDLDDAEVIEAPGEMVPVETPPATPPRGFAAPPPTPVRGIAAPREAVQEAGQLDESGPAWGSLSAREALDAYEERQAEASRAAIPPSSFLGEEIEDLHPAAEILPERMQAPVLAEFPDLELSLEAPDGFGPAAAVTPQSFPVPYLESGASPEVPWPSTMFPEPEPEPPLETEADRPPSFGSLPRPASGDAALDDALVEADVFRRYGLVEKAIDQLRPWLERAPGNLRIREKLFEIFLEQGQRAQAREQAEILAEAYGVSGREDRIRGLEGLLGEPLRAAPPAEVELLVAVAEPAVEELVVDAEQAGAGTEEPVEQLVAAFTEEPGEEQTLPEAEGGPTEPPTPAEVPFAVSQALEEPQTEVISAVIERVAAPPIEWEAAPEEPAAVLPEPELVVEPSGPADSAPVPVPEVLEDQAPVPIGEPAASIVPEDWVKARPRLSAEDVLGLGRGPAEPAPKKVRTVRPEDVELDLLGARGPKSKPKPPTKVEAVLPDDFLRSFRKPASVPEPLPVPEPAVAPEPEVLSALAAEPLQAEIAPIETVDAQFAGETVSHGVEPGLDSVEVADATPEVPFALLPQPTPEELSELDFCLDQGMVVDAAERLQSLEGRYPGDSELAARRMRLEGGRGGADAPRTALHDILSDDLDSVLDAELGRALTEDMVRESPAPGLPPQAMAAGAPLLDESGLFSDEQEFVNFADELHTELRRDVEIVPPEEGREVSLEEI